MRRHVSLFAEYFIQYSKVRLAYRGDFLISVLTTLTATLFGIAVAATAIVRQSSTQDRSEINEATIVSSSLTSAAVIGPRSKIRST